MPDPARRVLLIGAGDLADETAAALAAGGAEVRRLEDPAAPEVREALEDPTDAVTIVARQDPWPIRQALLVRHLDPDVRIVVTIFDGAVGRRLAEEIGNCRVTSLAEIVAPSLAGPCLDPDYLAVLDGERPQALRAGPDGPRAVDLPDKRPGKARAIATALLRPYDRSAALLFFGAVGLLLVLIVETVGAMIVLDQKAIDALYGAVKTLVTVDPNERVADGPGWFKGFISGTMIVALLFAACFTGGLVERLVSRRLTGLVGSRAVPRREHVIVVGLGQVGIRLCMLLRACNVLVVAVDPREDGENVGHARELGLPVVVGRGADPSLLRRLCLHDAHALVAVTDDDLENIGIAISAGSLAKDLRIVLRAGGDAVGSETQSLGRLGHVRDVHRIAACQIAGLALGRDPQMVVVVDGEPHLRDAQGRLERFPLSLAG